MKQIFTISNQLTAKLKRLAMVLTMLLIVGIGQAWGAEGDVLKTYNTNSSTFATGYSRKTGDNFVWWGQKGYYGANNATNHGNLKPTASDLPVVKAQNSSATTNTTGYYYLYTSEAIANVGKVEIKFTAKSGSSTVNAYIVSSSTEAASGSSTWTKVTLASNSSKAQGANVATATTYTFTFDATETDAKYYGVVFVTSSYWRATNLTFKLYEGAPSTPATPYTVTLKDDNSTLTQSTAGATITLPSRDGCDGYEFVGWTKSWSVAQTTWTTTAPTIIPTGSYTPTANESLYPVYTKTEGGGSEPTAYSAGDVGSFIIASNVGNKWYAIPENPTLSSNKITGVEITVSQTDGGVKYVSTANAEGYTWTIADATNGQTISDGTKYIYHSNGGSSGTNLAYGTSTSYTWKIEKENNGLTFKGMNGSTTNSRGLLFNGSVFGGYALSNEDQSGYYRIQVLPIGGGSTTYYISVPDCTTETAVYLIPKNSDFWMAHLRRIFGASSARVLPCRSVAYHSIINRLPVASSSHPPTPILIKRHTFMYGVVTRW